MKRRLEIVGLLVAGLALVFIGLSTTLYAPYHEAGLRDHFARQARAADAKDPVDGAPDIRSNMSSFRFDDRLPGITRMLYRNHSTINVSLLMAGVLVVVVGLVLLARRSAVFESYALVVMIVSLVVVSLVGAASALAYALPYVKISCCAERH